MPYAEVDLDVVEKLMLLGLSEDAVNLQLRAILWCNRNLTDGRIPKTALGALTAKPHAKKLVAELVTKSRWVDAGEFWEMHDYLDWNPSKDEVLERKARHAEVMRLHRKGKGARPRGRARDGLRDESRDESRDRSRDAPVTGSVTSLQHPASSIQRDPGSSLGGEVPDGPPADAGPPRPPRGTPVQLQEAWNAHHPPLPEWREWSEPRAKAARARLKERPIEIWREVIARMAASSFCRGEVPPREGSQQPFRADPDFLLKPGTAAKVLEGKYDDREQGRAPPRNVRTGRVAAEDTPAEAFAKEGRLAPGEF